MLKRFLNLFSSAVWIVRVDGEALKVVKGTVPPRFVSDCRGVLADAGIHAGQISGSQAGGYVTLNFSNEIPGRLQQRFRNLWAEYDKR
ncbi:DUF3634 family protein [Verrucomicrobiaceae bacterium 227]